MKKQFKILMIGHNIVIIAIHEFFHALMSFILNLKIGDYNVNGNYEEESGNWKTMGNVITYSSSPVRSILVSLAPVIFTLLIMAICIYNGNFILYMYFLCNLTVGHLMISKGDWENIKNSWKRIVEDNNVIKPVYNMFVNKFKK